MHLITTLFIVANLYFTSIGHWGNCYPDNGQRIICNDITAGITIRITQTNIAQ